MHDRHPALGPFALLAPIGRGASGVVWRAWHPASRTPLAIKCLLDARSPDDLRAMWRELRSVARMDHPGIVRVHDHGRLDATQADALGMAPDTPYIVMDFAGPSTLRNVLGRHPWSAIRRDLLGLLDALAHAHARGVVHRDLKPDNVLLGSQGPVLTDFGIALAYEQPETDDGSTGTPNYMSPEQVRSDARAIGPWTDLYAVGCLAYALATGRPPFAGRGTVGALKGHLRETPPRLGGPWPPVFASWVARLLSKAPGDRFAFAADAAWALAAIPEDAEAAAACSDRLVRRPLIPLPDWRRKAPPRPQRLEGVHRALADLRQIDPVGRADAQHTLWSALARVVRRGSLEVVVLDGATGCGTTHLARWLARRAHEHGIAEGLLARHDPDGGRDGLGPMLARTLRLDGLDEPKAVRQAARALGLAADDRAALVAAAAAAPGRQLLGVDTPVTLRTHSEFQVAAALTLDRLAARRPRVLVIDDAQWAPEGLDFARHLLDERREMPVLVVLTVLRDRADREVLRAVGRLGGHTAASVIRLEPLPSAAIGEIVRRLAPAGEALVDAIESRAMGDAGRAATLLRLWSARGALVQDDGGLRLARRAPPMPANDDGLWLERVQRAVPAMNLHRWQALELLATFTLRLDLDGWRALAEHAGLAHPEVMAQMLGPLGDAGLLADEPGGWGLAHARLREALLARAGGGGRAQRWHAACAATLAAHGEAFAERLGRHLVAAGQPAAAVDHFITGARLARRQTASRRVRRNLLAAARALRAAGLGTGDPRWSTLHARWALTDISRGLVNRARRRARRADRLARDPAFAALTAYVLGEATLAADPRAAEMHLRRGELNARRIGDVRLALRCAEARGWSLYHRGAFERVEEVVAAALAEPEAASTPLSAANLIFLRAVASRSRGEAAAHTHLALAARLYQREGARHGQASVRNEMGEVSMANGDPRAALKHYQTARAIFAELGHRNLIVADLNLGRACDGLGEHRRGEAHRREALRLAEQHGDPVMTAFAAVCLLVDAARGGRFDDLWPDRFARLEPLLEGDLVAAEAAEAAQRAGELAYEQGAHVEARQAFELAAIQFAGVGRHAEADAAEAAASGSASGTLVG